MCSNKMNRLVIALTLLATFASGFEEEDLHFTRIPGGLSGQATTTRYWDCCKPTCSWQGNIHFKGNRVRSCAADGTTTIDGEVQSGCVLRGNAAYVCNDNVAYVINDTLAYGFAAAAFKEAKDPEKCCACMLLKFQGELAGKSYLVQVTNTGTAVNVNTFDLTIPGGGVGYYTQGCEQQWNAPTNGWGDRYGGVHTAQECNNLPNELRQGCLFRFNWMKGVSNPPVTFEEVTCPNFHTSITGCRRP